MSAANRAAAPNSRRSRSRCGPLFDPTLITPHAHTAPTESDFSAPNPLPTIPTESTHQALNFIATTLDSDAFAAGLAPLLASQTLSAADSARFGRIPDIVAQGSSLGTEGPITQHFSMPRETSAPHEQRVDPDCTVPPNAPASADMVRATDEMFLRELSLGRMSGPFTIKEVEAAAGSPVRAAPL